MTTIRVATFALCQALQVEPSFRTSLHGMIFGAAPTRHPAPIRWNLYFALSPRGAVGAHAAVLFLRRPDGRRTVEKKVEFKIAEPRQVFTIKCGPEAEGFGLTFETPGDYALELEIDGEVLAEIPLNMKPVTG